VSAPRPAKSHPFQLEKSVLLTLVFTKVPTHFRTISGGGFGFPYLWKSLSGEDNRVKTGEKATELDSRIKE
jgi:hypothetical protein